MVPVETPSAMPNTPSVVSHMCDISRLSDAPLCESNSGSHGPPML